MAAKPRPIQPVTFDEYLELEEASTEKHELVDGELHAFAGGTGRHGRIVSNLMVQLGNAALDTQCTVFASDMKIRLSEKRGYYPDVMIACDPFDDTLPFITDPCVVVEVASPSTAQTDRREKLPAYRQLANLQLVLLVAQDRMRVERHWRDANGIWWEAVLGPGDHIPIPCIDVELPVTALYRGMLMPAPSDDW
jgi:Uma2 family endonuclease